MFKQPCLVASLYIVLHFSQLFSWTEFLVLLVCYSSLVILAY